MFSSRIERMRTTLLPRPKGWQILRRRTGSSFGRLMMLKVDGVGEKALVLGFDVNDPSTRKKALKLRNNEEVQGLFQTMS